LLGKKDDRKTLDNLKFPPSVGLFRAGLALAPHPEFPDRPALYDMKENQFDVIILGTGLVESITAA
jgi:hypothetical protein